MDEYSILVYAIIVDIELWFIMYKVNMFDELFKNHLDWGKGDYYEQEIKK